ncbi:hypothetical protein [Synechococcus sp. M16CYN]
MLKPSQARGLTWADIATELNTPSFATLQSHVNTFLGFDDLT